MSNFDNGGLGDGGLGKSKEKLHADGTPIGEYSQLSYEELKRKIEEFFAETPLPEMKIDLWVSSPKGWICYEDSPQFHEDMRKEVRK